MTAEEDHMIIYIYIYVCMKRMSLSNTSFAYR